MTPDEADPLNEVAAMYNYGLGGKDNTELARSVLDAVIKLDPGLRNSIREHRNAVLRGVAVAAQDGVRQFLDLGSGLPDPDGRNIYDIVQVYQPDARVVYVDVAPIPASHGRALLGRIAPTLMVQADVREPARVLKHAFALLNPDEPIGLIGTALVHFWPDKVESARILRTYMKAFTGGGYFLFSHACADMDPQLREAMREVYRRGGAAMYPRTQADIAAFLDGLILFRPGVMEASEWRRDPGIPLLPIGQAKFLFAMAGFGPYGENTPAGERYTLRETA